MALFYLSPDQLRSVLSTHCVVFKDRCCQVFAGGQHGSLPQRLYLLTLALLFNTMALC